MSSEHHSVEFSDVIGFPGYRVSRCGVVQTRWERKAPGPWNLGETWKTLKQRTRANRRKSVTLSRNKKSFTRFVHRLVLEAFIGPCPEGMQCCHFDGDPQNNNLDNLRWDTPEGNAADSIRHGTNAGERNGMAKIDKAKVIQIRSEYAALPRYGAIKVLAARHHLCENSIWNIIHGRNWKRVT